MVDLMGYYVTLHCVARHKQPVLIKNVNASWNQVSRILYQKPIKCMYGRDSAKSLGYVRYYIGYQTSHHIAVFIKSIQCICCHYIVYHNNVILQ